MASSCGDNQEELLTVGSGRAAHVQLLSQETANTDCSDEVKLHRVGKEEHVATALLHNGEPSGVSTDTGTNRYRPAPHTHPCGAAPRP